jgi:hypothetical protein
MPKKILAGLALCACCSSLGARASAREADRDPDSEADNYADVWLRLDADRVGAQFWVGGTTPIGHLELSSNLVITQTYPGVVDPLQGADYLASGDDYRAPAIRVELGPALATGGFFFLPKVGIGFDIERETVAPLVPQLISIIQGGPLYIESWAQFFLYDMFDDGAQDSFYTRDMVLVALDNHWALGVQAELSVALQNSPESALRSLSVGPRSNWSPVEAFTLGLYVGYESQEIARNSENDFVAGRATATLLW